MVSENLSGGFFSNRWEGLKKWTRYERSVLSLWEKLLCRHVGSKGSYSISSKSNQLARLLVNFVSPV